MELQKHKVELDPSLGIILMEHSTETVTLDEIVDVSNRFRNSTGRNYKYGIIKRVPGYYFSYRLSDRKIICCGTMSKKDCIDETRDFARKN